MTGRSKQTWVCRPAGVGGTLSVPGDKSISHRAVLLGSLANGVSEVKGFLPGADCVATLAAMRAMGVEVEVIWPDHLRIHGVGLHGLQAPQEPLDMGNSGTGMRLLAGLLAGQDFSSVLTGDESLSRRPMDRVAVPLRAMGADIATEAGHAPLRIVGRKLQPIRYLMPVASAQVKSAILLAALYAEGETVIAEPGITRDHTERMLRTLGCELGGSGQRVTIRGGQPLQACDIDVPGDFSAAAFFITAAAINEGSELVLTDVGVNRTRIGLLDLLTEMGADISLSPPRAVGTEHVADIRVRGMPLRGIDVPPELVPLAIDEFPVFFVAAACASGTTRVSGAAELRHKESDRIQAMADGLSALGISARALPDGIMIAGGQIRGGQIDSCGDHRIAMAFAVAATVAAGPVQIADIANVATSFPDFADRACSVGMDIAVQADE